MNVEVTPLPGIGVRQDFETRAGRRIGVITYRDGRLELLVYRLDDPDACSASLPLTGEEAGDAGHLLGAPHLVEQIADAAPRPDRHRDAPDRRRPGSPFDGATLGDTALRTRTGVVRSSPSSGAAWSTRRPRPDFILVAGDLLVVVGTEEGLAEAAEILQARADRRRCTHRGSR